MFRLRFSNRRPFKADKKEIISIYEYLELNPDEVGGYKVQPKDRAELNEAIEETLSELGKKADLNFIDVSRITDMRKLFFNSGFNGNISKWDVSNVSKMNSMFRFSEFNGNISKWDVSNVTDMEWMFAESPFKGDLSKWKINTDQTTGMFSGNPLKNKWGANAELLKGGTLHLTAQEMNTLLEKINSYIRKKYSSKFEKFTDFVINDDPDYGSLQIGVEDDKVQDKFAVYPEIFDNQGDDAHEMYIQVEVYAEKYEDSDTKNPAIEIGVFDDDVIAYTKCGYVEIDTDKIKDSKYLEKKIDKAMKYLLDELK